MSQALRDLPDPLLPPPVFPSSSPDDLLAKMADEAIDELMAAADKGEAFKSEPMVFPAQTPAAPPASTDDALGTPPATAETPTTVDDARAVAPAVESVASPVPPSAEAIAAPAPVAVPAAATADETGPADDHHGVAAAHPPTAVEPAGVEPDTAAADVRTLLQEETPRPSPLLWPLRVINAPFDWLGDRGRLFVGLLGFVTLIPAICAVIYVLFMRGK